LTIKAVYGLPVMKALSIRTADDLKRVEAYIGIADRFLFDAKPPKGSELPGGNGVSFDWSLLAWLDGSVDYMLSGGLNKAISPRRSPSPRHRGSTRPRVSKARPA
jgi:phosphoribosylanthranilate isomerase